MNRNALTGLALACLIVGLAGARWFTGSQVEAAALSAPAFEVDPFWPKPLPNHWVLGSAIGLSVDSRDHVFIIHRPQSLNARTEVGGDQDPQTGECCFAAPNVLEFDPAGNLVNYWGGPGDGYDWPTSNHGITVDHKDNVWIGGNGRGDAHLLKFSRKGDFLFQIGSPGAALDSTSTEHFGRVAEIDFDPQANEAYVADGYTHHRVAVLDADTGAFKRFWGAYGEAPTDEDLGPYDPAAPPAKQFRNPVHCAQPTRDGHVYVCDRANDRIQVFEYDGTYVDELMLAPMTRGDGSVWDIAFSRDPEQRFMYVADGKNERIYVVERRSLTLLTSFGDGGRQPGQFFGVHNIATDSKGNIYTTETYEGKRLQKFVYRGMRAVKTMEQGVPWPAGD